MKDYEYRDNNGNPLDYYTIVNDATQMLREIEEKDKEIQRLNNELDKTRLSELHKEYIIDELEKWLNEQKDFIQTIDMMPNLKEIKVEHKIMFNDYINVLDKLKKLKEGK